MGDPGDPIRACGSCHGPIEPGALRCRHCGAAFEGKDRQPRMKPTVWEEDGPVSIGEDGLLESGQVGLNFGFVPEDEPED